MEVDGSFAEYVAARWSMHYRLAVLLVGTDAADALTQAALVRAYASWDEVQRASSADEYVKEILANTAVRADATRQQPGPADDHTDLWSRVIGLSLRQRAVVVLRWYELLSDDEIARAIGGRTDEIAADAASALPTLQVTSAELAAELASRAEECDVPLPPLAELVARGGDERRRRRRRSWRWAAGVAGVVAVGVVLTSLVQGATSDAPDPSRPTPSAEALPAFLRALPSGDPPLLAYSVRRSLHLGSGRTVALPDKPIAIVQTKKWLFVAFESHAMTRVDIATTETQVVADAFPVEVVTDPAGEHVAWHANGAGPAVVVVQTVADGAVLLDDRQAFPSETRCCDERFVVNGITGDEIVIASMPSANRAWAWDTPDAGTDSAVREISGLGNGVVHQVTATEIAAQYGASHFAIGELVDGDYLVKYELNARMADFGDPRARRVLYVDSAGEFHVVDRRTRGHARTPDNVRLQLPALVDGFTSARWEDEDHVLLDVSDTSIPGGALVRCDVDTGGCEIAVRFDGPHLVAR